MNLTEFIKIVTESGMGVVAFAALLYGGYRLLTWLEKVSGYLEELKDNHLKHVQDSLEKINENTMDGNKKLDAQTQILGVIVDQTKKDN